MAGYSGTPLIRKLGIKEDSRIVFIHPPQGLDKELGKLPAGVATDLSEGVVREVGLAAGLVDVKVCAIDEVWSGLKFVIRIKDRKRSLE